MQALELNPDFYHTHWSLARTLEQLGQFDRAIREYKTAIQANQSNLMILAELGHCYGVMGRYDLVEAISAKLQGARKDRYVSPLCLFFVHLGMSLYKEALEDLEIAIEQRIGMLTSLPFDPRIDRIRPESTFKKLLSTLGAPIRAEAG
jgi:tetratricopeptide (TPR) repeat protein